MFLFSHQLEVDVTHLEGTYNTISGIIIVKFSVVPTN